MNEQELRDEFEHEAWCDTQNNISKICNCMMGYPLEVIENLQETIKAKDAEIENLRENFAFQKFEFIRQAHQLDEKDRAIVELESRLEQSVDISVVNELNETIEKQKKEIAEARLFLHDLYWLNRHDREAIKTWLESNK